jgi:hypothetical protein
MLERFGVAQAFVEGAGEQRLEPGAKLFGRFGHFVFLPGGLAVPDSNSVK